MLGVISPGHLFDRTVLHISTDITISKIIPLWRDESQVLFVGCCAVDVLSAGLEPEASCLRRRILCQIRESLPAFPKSSLTTV
jgi:hypothetical protein